MKDVIEATEQTIYIDINSIAIINIGDNLFINFDNSFKHIGTVENVWYSDGEILVRYINDGNIIVRKIVSLKNNHVFVKKTIVFASDLDGKLAYQLHLFDNSKTNNNG